MPRDRSVEWAYLPEGFDPKRVSFGSIWGIHADELDIPWIWRLDLGG